jgi:transcriptional regulator with XRE-family HTH domain
MIMDVISRIKSLISLKAKSEREFAMRIGVNQVTLNNYTMERRKVSYEIIEAILKAFPEISAEWLMRGVGDMETSSDPVKLDNDLNETALYKRIIDEQLDTINMLKKRIVELESKNSNESSNIA